MNIKKIYVLVLSICMIFALYACKSSETKKSNVSSTTVSNAAGSVPDATDDQSQENPDNQKETIDVSIPDDSSLADSVFEEDKEPTKPAGGDSVESENTEDPTEPDDSTETESTTPDNNTATPDVKPEEMTYAEFIALTPEEQRLYQESFNDLDAFFKWFNAAKEQYEKENPPIDIDGPIDLGKY